MSFADGNLTGMVLGMLAIAATWTAALAAFAGMGLAYLRWSEIGRDGSGGLLGAVWIGWAFTVGALQIWHILWPVDTRARVLILALGGGGLLWCFPYLLRQFRSASRRTLVFSVMALLLAVWLANQAMAPTMHYDAGLYHIGTIRWIQAYPIVPGLGNLHGRLAYNSSYFLYMAALDFGPWSHRAQHVAVYLLLLMLSLQVGASGYEILLRSRPVTARDLFRFALLPVVVAKLFTGMNDAEHDLAVWVLGIVVVDQLIGLLLDGAASKDSWTGVFLVLMLSSAALVVKLSAAVLGIVGAGIALVWMAKRGGIGDWARVPSRAWLAIIAPPVLLIAVWMARGFVLSGYPAYPSTLGGLNVDWRVPAGIVSIDRNWIMSWARIPGENPDSVLAGWGWLKPWSDRIAQKGLFEIMLPLALSMPCLLAAVLRRRRWERPALTLAILGVVPISSLGYWFATAPLVRYVGAAPWLLAAISLLLAAERWGVLRSHRFAAGLLLVSLAAGVTPYRTAEKFWNAGSENGFYPLPQPYATEVSLPSGLTVLDPVEGDQCWDAPLLCTGDVQMDLQPRVAGKLGSGFRAAPGGSEP